MFERHDLLVIDLMKALSQGEQISKFGRTVEITKGERIKFVGFLVGKSIVIPLSAGRDSEDYLSQIAGANLETVKQNSRETPEEATCHLLGLPYCAQTLGMYSDGRTFGQINTIHFHPEIFVATQDDFIALATASFSHVGASLKILE